MFFKYFDFFFFLDICECKESLNIKFWILEVFILVRNLFDIDRRRLGVEVVNVI